MSNNLTDSLIMLMCGVHILWSNFIFPKLCFVPNFDLDPLVLIVMNDDVVFSFFKFKNYLDFFQFNYSGI